MDRLINSILEVVHQDQPLMDFMQMAPILVVPCIALLPFQVLLQQKPFDPHDLIIQNK